MAMKQLDVSKHDNSLSVGIDRLADTQKLMPATNDPRELAARRYYNATKLVSLATAAKEAAEKLCVLEGVLIDKVRDKRPLGTDIELYRGDGINACVSTGLKVDSSGQQLDAKLLEAELIKLGLKPAQVVAALNAAKKDKAPAHKFRASLISAPQEAGDLTSK